MSKTVVTANADQADKRKWLDRPLSFSILAGALLMAGGFAFASPGETENADSINVPVVITEDAGIGPNSPFNNGEPMVIESGGFGSLPD